LRRALSTAYYALFHFLIREAVRQIGPNLSEDNYNRVYRWFDHGAMKRVAWAFSQETVLIPNSRDVLAPNTGAVIQFVAEHFAYLQGLRHLADYDPGAVFIRADVLAMIDRVDTAFWMWTDARTLPKPIPSYSLSSSGKNGASAPDAPSPRRPSLEDYTHLAASI
jgi:hypothetical protein